jgi:peptidoglycan/xylan/chitin deacetylase (PgdA/CDA1 family)
VLNPDRIIRKLAKRYPHVVYAVDTREPAVALTIDDGPHPATTDAILDVLRQHGARATFFLITGRIAGNERIVRRIVDEGHEIANHLTADQPSINLSPLEFERALLKSHETLRQFARVRWFRPGSGWYNGMMLAILYKHGYQCALGSVYPYDAAIPSSRFAARYVLARVGPGSVIVLHDGGDRGRRTAATLSVILPELALRGLEVVTLSELAGGDPMPWA